MYDMRNDLLECVFKMCMEQIFRQHGPVSRFDFGYLLDERREEGPFERGYSMFLAMEQCVG